MRSAGKRVVSAGRVAACLLAGTWAGAAAGAAGAERPDKRLAEIMAVSEADLVAIVPAQCPDVTCACPRCARYVQWAWSHKAPMQIRCSACGTTYPGADYPMDRTQAFLNFIGERVVLPYHRGRTPAGGMPGRPHPDRYFLNAPIDDHRYGWVVNQALPRLVEAYRATGGDLYARRAALLLDALARNYKHYLVHRGRGRGYYVSTGGPWPSSGS